jgi:KDO2-lipid IV(A) lauroyltransferase
MKQPLAEPAPEAQEISPWKRRRQRLETWLLRLVEGGIPWLPRGAVLRLARALGDLAWRLDRRGREVALANLEIAFGDRYTEEERARIGRDSYRNMARTMLELFWSPNIGPHNVRDFLEFDPPPELAALRAEGRPVIFTGLHYGNWEFNSILLGYAGIEAMVLANDLKNPEAGLVIERLRARGGQIPIGRQNSVLRLLKRIRGGGTIGILVDQTLRPEWPSVAVEFFGLPVCATTLEAELARRTGAPLVHLWCRPEADGRYTIVCDPPLHYPRETGNAEIVQNTMRVFEESIRRRPDLYVWNYKHWRYMPRGTQLRFPFYANVSGAFDKKVAADRPQVDAA